MSTYPTIIILGAASELNPYLLKRIVHRHYNIILLDNNEITLKQLQSKYGNFQAYISYYKVNWNDYENLENIFNQIYIDHHFIDIAVSLLDSCYYKDLSLFATLHETVEMNNINYIINVLMLHSIVPMMLEENRGKIILLGERKISSHSYKKYSCAYFASKAALIAYCRELQKLCFGKNLQLSVINFNDPVIFTPEKIDGKSFYSTKNEIPILEQNINVLASKIIQ